MYMARISKRTRFYLPNVLIETTFFSPTFKVEENKVTLFFSYLAYRPRYGHFMVKNGHFWLNGTISLLILQNRHN